MFDVDLKGEKTIANLKTALQGEVMACIKYYWYSLQADKEGYKVIGNILDKRLAMKTNMRECGSKHCMVDPFQTQNKI